MEAGFFLCAYEFAIQELNSPWCQLFDEVDAQVLEQSGFPVCLFPLPGMVVFKKQRIIYTLNRELYIHYVTLDHKTSLKSLGFICSSSQNTLYWPNLQIFILCQKISSKDHVP